MKGFTMRHIDKQTGLTLLGFMMVVALVCFFALVGLKLFPLYNESFAVDQSLKSVANQPEAEKLTTRDIHKYFIRNANINGLSRFKERNISDYLSANKIGEKPREMYMYYEARSKLFGNLDIVLVYDKTFELGGN
ncbi:MAG: DUF4845 domain-containing protein [Gammaproteobacteria bacterium]|nr:DUF4845 domain-containing protein [Gammaproteobacteria bacterium]